MSRCFAVFELLSLHRYRSHYTCPRLIRSQSNNILLMGCNVVEGEGTGLIIATGKQNQLSKIASSAGVDAAPTSLQVSVGNNSAARPCLCSCVLRRTSSSSDEFLADLLSTG